jgi:hypothetical protein
MKADKEDDRQAQRRFLKEMMQMMDTSHKEIMAEIKPERDMETRWRNVQKKKSRPQWT